jgi:hypothetical protein
MADKHALTEDGVKASNMRFFLGFLGPLTAKAAK